MERQHLFRVATFWPGALDTPATQLAQVTASAGACQRDWLSMPALGAQFLKIHDACGAPFP